jgi:hypothetical protein
MIGCGASVTLVFTYYEQALIGLQYVYSLRGFQAVVSLKAGETGAMCQFEQNMQQRKA